MNSIIAAFMSLITAILSLFYVPSELKSVNPAVIPARFLRLGGG